VEGVAPLRPFVEFDASLLKERNGGHVEDCLYVCLVKSVRLSERGERKIEREREKREKEKIKERAREGER